MHFARETPEANPAFMDIEELRRAKVPTYNNEVLVRNHFFENIVAIYLMLAIGTVNM